MRHTLSTRRAAIAAIALGINVACNRHPTTEGAGKKPSGKSQAVPDPIIAQNELQLEYCIAVEDGNTISQVSERFQFENGSRFRLRLRPGFDAHIYLLNRGSRERSYSFLYPHKDIPQENPVPAKQMIEVPDSRKSWLAMDRDSGTEHMVLIASPLPLSEFNVPAATIERDEFEERLGRVERDHRPVSSRRVETRGWVSLLASREGGAVMVMRLPLEHRR